MGGLRPGFVEAPFSRLDHNVHHEESEGLMIAWSFWVPLTGFAVTSVLLFDWISTKGRRALALSVGGVAVLAALVAFLAWRAVPGNETPLRVYVLMAAVPPLVAGVAVRSLPRQQGWRKWRILLSVILWLVTCAAALLSIYVL